MPRRSLSPQGRLVALALAAAALTSACGVEEAGLPQSWSQEDFAPALPEALPADEGQSAPEVGLPSGGSTDVRLGGPRFDTPRLPGLAPRVATLRPWIADAPESPAPAIDTSAPPPTPGLDEGAVCTYTVAQFGQPCGTEHGDAACMLGDHFDELFGSLGLVIGGVKTVRFTSAEAVADALPGQLAASVLDAAQVDPGVTETNAFTSQIAALAINLALSDAGLGGSEDLAAVRLAHGPLTGITVGQIFEMSQGILGGEQNTLSALGFTPDLLVPVLDRINRAGHDCAVTVMLVP